MGNKVWKLEIAGKIAISAEFVDGSKYGTLTISETSSLHDILRFSNEVSRMYSSIDPKPSQDSCTTEEYLDWHRRHHIDPFPDWPSDGHGFGTSGVSQGGYE